MATFNVGRVQPIHKGEWSELTSYKEMDVVSLNGSSFWAIQDSTGLNPLDNPTYWEVISEKGESGVYVGSEEPTNPDVNVWVDTDEQPDVPQIEEHNTSIDAHANMPVNQGFLKDQNSGLIKFWKGTQEQFDEITPDAETIYFVGV